MLDSVSIARLSPSSPHSLSLTCNFIEHGTQWENNNIGLKFKTKANEIRTSYSCCLLDVILAATTATAFTLSLDCLFVCCCWFLENTVDIILLKWKNWCGINTIMIYIYFTDSLKRSVPIVSAFQFKLSTNCASWLVTNHVMYTNTQSMCWWFGSTQTSLNTSTTTTKAAVAANCTMRTRNWSKMKTKTQTRKKERKIDDVYVFFSSIAAWNVCYGRPDSFIFVLSLSFTWNAQTVHRTHSSISRVAAVTYTIENTFNMLCSDNRLHAWW